MSPQSCTCSVLIESAPTEPNLAYVFGASWVGVSHWGRPGADQARVVHMFGSTTCPCNQRHPGIVFCQVCFGGLGYQGQETTQVFEETVSETISHVCLSSICQVNPISYAGPAGFPGSEIRVVAAAVWERFSR